MKPCLYDLAIKTPWRYIFQYPLALIFLVDFHMNYKRNQEKLQGDVATNVSSSLARALGLIGAIIYSLKKFHQGY